MSWFILFIAGLLEVGWAVGLKYTEGFSKPIPTVLVIFAIVASMGLLGLALRDLPVGTGYAVWVGIGIVGTSILGIFLYQEAVNLPKILFLGLLIVSIVGLKLTTPGQ